MKIKIYYLFIISLFIVSCASLNDGTKTVKGAFDRSKQPKAGPTPTVNLGKPQTFELSNGLKIIVVENHKLPRASATLTIDNEPYYAGDKAGVSSLLGSLLGTGTKTISKDDFNEEIDFLGANVFFGSNRAGMRSLSKFFPRVFELMADAALNPVFAQEEFDKEVAKLIDGIKVGEKSVATIGSRVESALAFGINHPYGEFASKETVENVSLQDVKERYNNYYKPNNAYLVITGDVDFDKVKTLVEQYFSDWQSAVIPKYTVPDVENVVVTEINFVDMPNASQTRIKVLSTTKLKMNHPDFFPVLVANQIFGGDFNSYLNMNLREEHGFTYGARSRLKADKYISLFSAGADVRHEVADSAIVETMKELNRIRTEKVDGERLEDTKANFAGKFVRALEKPETIARYALNIKVNDLPEDFYETYLRKINDVTSDDIQRVAKKYFSYDNARIVVTSKAIDVLPALEKLPYPINFYDKKGMPTTKPKLPESVSADVTVESIIANYLAALGGREKLESIKSVVQETSMEMQGMAITQIIKSKLPNLISQETIMMGQTASKLVFDGEDGYMMQMGNKMPLPPEQLAELKEKTGIFEELYYGFDDNELTIEGIFPIEGKEAYKIIVISPSGKKVFKYYDKQSGLLIKQESFVKNPMTGEEMIQPMIFSDYKENDGIKIPHKLNTQMMGQDMEMVVTSVKFNIPLTEEDFK